MNVSRPFDKFPQHAEGLIHVFKSMFGQQPLPLRLGAFELARERCRIFAFARIGLQQPVEDPTDVSRVSLERGLELGQRLKSHQTGQAFPVRQVGRDGVCLQVVLHLQAVLHVAQEAIGLGEHLRLVHREQFVLDQLGQRRKGLRALEKWLPAGTK